jgi:hypothetical protein
MSASLSMLWPQICLGPYKPLRDVRIKPLYGTVLEVACAFLDRLACMAGCPTLDPVSSAGQLPSKLQRRVTSLHEQLS